MPGTVSFDGLATGINTTETVDKLIEVESRPKILKEAEKVRYENQKAAWQEVDTKLLALREEARNLWRSTTWNTYSATSSNAGVLTATASSSAQPGVYTFQVSQLAQNHQIASESFAASTDTVGTGDLTITVGTASTTITLDGSQSLSDLAAAINAQSDVAVSASVINDGSGYRLLLYSDDAGAANAISLQRDTGVTIFDDATLGQSSATAYYDELEAAQDAVLQFGSGADPITVTSDTNTVTNLATGLTLNLLSASPGTSVTISVARDSSGMEEKVQAFVDAYNDAWDYITSQTAYDAATETRGVLMGDLTIESIKNRTQGILIGSVETGGSYKTLRSIGISMEDDGSLKFDTVTFSEATTADFESVENVFRATDGISEQLSDYLGDLTNPFGTIDNKEEALTNTITRIQDRIDELEERLEVRRESLLEQFYRMESVINELNGEGTYLMNALASLNPNTRK